MPLLERSGITTYYRLEGADDGPTLVFSHSLGQDHGMWDVQTADVLPYYRVLRYDIRGHGASSATPGDYTVEQLAHDLLALVDACRISTFAFCGLSLGGMIGQWLAANVPDRLTHLVLANTSARLSDPQVFETRRRVVLESGIGAVADTIMGRFFSAGFLASNSPQVGSSRRTLLSTDPIGYAGCCAAIRDLDQRALLPTIRTPTLVIAGNHDVPMPWFEHGQILTESIPGARAVRLPAAHLSNLERPRSFSAALLDFLVPAPPDLFEAGMGVRRATLGHDHVDRSIGSTTDLTRNFQALITSYAWGTIWTRPGLDPRTRRLLVLMATVALGRWEEFRLHVKTGLAHELEPCDLEEVLLQAAVYAGVPAANTAFQIASEEIASAR